MRSDGDSAKDPGQLEREVDEQRREIGDTIHALEEKFSSREMYNRASGYLREHGGEFAQSLSNSIKANPLPVALTAIGLIWTMVGQRPSTRMPAYRSESSHSTVAGLKEKGSHFKEQGAHLRESGAATRDRVSARAHDVRDRASAAGRNLRERAGHAREGLSHSMEGARGGFERYMREQPMAVGAMAIALGALIGAAIPRTEAENRTFGSIGERARSKASELAEKGYQKAGEMGESVRSEAQDTFHSESRPEHRTTPSGRSPEGPTATP